MGGHFDQLQTGSVQLGKQKVKVKEQHPYEQLINEKLMDMTASPNEYPSVTFQSKELFDQANFLS